VKAVFQPRYNRRAVRGCVLGLLVPLLLTGCRDRAPGGKRPARAGARVLWSAAVGTWAGLESSPAVGSGGTVYTPGSIEATLNWKGQPALKGTRQGCLFEVDASSGAVLRELPGSVIRDGTFQIWARVAPWGTVYGVDSEGGLYGMFSDGRQAFRSVGQRLMGPPAIDGSGRLLVGSWKGLLGFDLEAQDAAAAFVFRPGDFSRPPVVGPDGTFYTATLRGVYAVDPLGDVKWSVREAGRTASTLDEAGRLFFTSKNRLVALDAGGSKLWEYHGDDDLGAPALAADGTVVVIGAGGLVQAVGAADGQRQWSYAMDTARWSLPAAGPDGAVYVSDRKGRVSAIDPGGRLRWSLRNKRACGTPAVGDGGIVYIECRDGKLYALSPS
jgi:outer membrane protein assembly factor BamB